MRAASILGGLALAFAVTSAPATADSMIKRSGTERHALVKRAHQLARDEVLSTLPSFVREDLAKRDPNDYQVHYEHLLDRYMSDEAPLNELERRAEKFDAGGPAHDGAATWVNGHGPGIGQCGGKRVAITFDDGPYENHLKLAQKFKDANQFLTFFVNGNNFGCIYDKPYPRQMRKAWDLGVATYGSHTWSHANLTSATSDDQILKQLHLVEEALYRILGVVPRYLRPPYGETNRRILKLMKDNDYKVVQWNTNNGDGDGLPPAESIKIWQSIEKANKVLMLNHETHADTVNKVVPAGLEHLKQAGIQTVPLERCLKHHPAPYKVTAKRSKRTDEWTCVGKPAPGKFE
ncbi:chitin deacetylase [Ceraceosorus bombacis]|uniref:Chitin deacetylase n=1 Tax=Ceraceosorus bombacis TaxID=401625 RepID=A0A0P1BK49_9BASI|nr:chitin deacetylase [Ceraceosorus bombacis]